MADTASRDWFGHPKGLTVLAGSEMWERFSFYGMQALLMLYMTKYLLLPEHAGDVLGLAAFRAALSSLVGPMTDLAFASQTYGLYSGLIYGTPLIGAWLGDRVLGKTRTVTLGCLLMSAGHLLMASEHFFLFALLLLILGAGGVIGNMAAQVGQLYAPEDQRRTRAFGVYLITLNIGALVAPLVVGTLGEKVGWHWGFGAAGIGMLIGLTTYLAGRSHLPPEPLIERGRVRQSLTRGEWRRVIAILILLLPYLLYTAGANQAYGIMLVWADTAVERHLLGWEVPVTWIGIVDGLLTILGVVVASRFWIAQGRNGREPGDFIKMAIGYGQVTAAYLLVALTAMLPVVPLLAWVAFYVVLDFGYAWVEPPIQALVTRDAPPTLRATMMAVLKFSSMFAYFLLGWLGRFYEPLGAPAYWAMTALLPLSAMLIIGLARRPLLRALSET